MGLCERIAKALRTHYQRIAKVTNCYQVLPLATKTTTGKNLLHLKCGSFSARTNSDLLGQTRTRESGVKVA